MAEKQLEARQKELRRMDYDSLSDSDDEVITDVSRSSVSAGNNNKNNNNNAFVSPAKSSASIIRQRGEAASTPIPGHRLDSSSFDPYAASNNEFSKNSLFDDQSVQSVQSVQSIEMAPVSDVINESQKGPVPKQPTNTSSLIPGGAGYLEMEEEPPRQEKPRRQKTIRPISDNEPIKTSSGLLLTHRRSPTNSNKQKRPSSQRNFDSSPSGNAYFSNGSNSNSSRGGGGGGGGPGDRAGSGTFRHTQRDYFEVENGYPSWNPKSTTHKKHSMGLLQAKRFMSFVRLWVVVSAVFLVAATGVFMHSFRHSGSNGSSQELTISPIDDANMEQQQQQQQYFANGGNNYEVPEQIILVPMENISEFAERDEQQQNRRQLNIPMSKLGFHETKDIKNHKSKHEKHSSHHDAHKHSHKDEHGVKRVMSDLRDEFEAWVSEHGKTYHSNDEKEQRFHIWSQNHHRTIEKNRRHGPCKMTQQPVFGSNMFKDLSPDEFKSQFLNRYKGPTTDELEKHPLKLSPNIRKLSKPVGEVLNPKHQKPKYHEALKQRMLTQQQQPAMQSSSSNCSWYDISCLLRYIWEQAGVQFGSLVGTMEPAYDASTYPNAVDWRDSGAVTDVRSQGDCGACWAITAVETVESAHFISTGNLYDLSEGEIITCDDSCEMCEGGWPQNAFEWVMDHGGLPLSNSFAYDGSSLQEMTAGILGESDTWTEDLVKEYRQQVCPSGDGSQDSKDSQEYYDDGKENENYGDYSDQGRYGNVKGYGYATDRCVCYSDGSGCDCDNQDEDTAVANLATYGPAVVCLEASLWQDYSGGIITTDLGCGSAFLDMNHCVQAVGYRFTDGSEDDDEDGDDDQSGSGSNSKSGDENGRREGYWIIRNQWGNWWGMNGYAYVAMGENTCGVLNDMTQAYL